jgi:hypothetical protein
MVADMVYVVVAHGATSSSGARRPTTSAVAGDTSISLERVSSLESFFMLPFHEIAFLKRLWQRAAPLKVPARRHVSRRLPGFQPRLAAFHFRLCKCGSRQGFACRGLCAAWAAAAPPCLFLVAGSPEAAPLTAKSRPYCNGSLRPEAGLLQFGRGFAFGSPFAAKCANGSQVPPISGALFRSPSQVRRLSLFRSFGW